MTGHKNRGEGLILRNSLFISLLAGNLGLRRVRVGLRPQPASAVSAGLIQFIGKRPRLPQAKGRLPVSAARKDVPRRPYLANLAGSLRSQIFNIQILKAET